MDDVRVPTGLRLVTNEEVETAEPIEQLRDAGIDGDSEWRAKLKKLGVYTPDMLAQVVKAHAKQRYLVEGLIRPKSINLLVGDSGLGKTPLGMQLGLAVSAGLPFLERTSEQGRVLYCDAESDPQTFQETLESIRRFLGLQEKPQDFLVWSPNWESRLDLSEAAASSATKLITRVRCVEPTLVIVDPLRMFWSKAETGSEEAADLMKQLRDVSRHTGCAWVITHHRRKANQQVAIVRLEDDPRGWFQEAAGAHALVNQSDSRIGVVLPHSGRADLLLGGFIRNTGPFVPLDLARATDGDGNPVGYRLLTGTEHLNSEQQIIYGKLQDHFRFKDVSRAMGGTSDSNSTNFVKKCVSLGIVKKDGKDYIKTSPPVECVERVEYSPATTPFTPSTPPPDDLCGPPPGLAEDQGEDAVTQRIP